MTPRKVPKLKQCLYDRIPWLARSQVCLGCLELGVASLVHIMDVAGRLWKMSIASYIQPGKAEGFAGRLPLLLQAYLAKPGFSN